VGGEPFSETPVTDLLKDRGGIHPPGEEPSLARKGGEYAGIGTEFLATLMAGGPVLKGLEAGTGVVSKGLGKLGNTIRQQMIARPAATLTGETISGGLMPAGEVVGEKAGGALGEAVGGETGRAVGEDVGHTFGGLAGAAAPHASAAGVAKGVERAFAKPDGTSGLIYDALVRLGVRPSALETGNIEIQRILNALGMMPIGGKPVHKLMTQQTDEFGGALRDAAHRSAKPGTPKPTGAAREEMLDTPAPEVESIGARISELANAGVKNLRKSITKAEIAFTESVGKKAPVALKPLLQKLRKEQSKHTGGLADILEGIHTSLMKDYERIGVVIDKGVQSVLVAQRRKVDKTIATIEGKMAGLSNRSPAYKQLKTDLKVANQEAAEVLKQLLDNMALPYEALREFRTILGVKSGTGLELAKHTRKEIYEVLTNEIRNMARRVGGKKGGKKLADDFDALMAADEAKLTARKANAGLPGSVPYLQKLGEKEPDAAVAALTTKARQSPNRVTGFTENVPDEQLGEVLGDTLANLGRSPVQHTYTGRTEYDYNTFLKGWGKMSRATKKALTRGDEDLLKHMDDLELVATALEDAAKTGNPTRVTQAMNTMRLLAPIMGPMSIGAIQTLGVLAGSRVLTSILTSQAVARIVAGRAPGFAERFLTAEASNFLKQWHDKQGGEETVPPSSDGPPVSPVP